MQGALILLATICAVGIIGHNYSVAIASGVLFLLRLLGANQVLTYLQAYGLDAGVIILTAAVLTPVATGGVGPGQLKGSFLSPLGLLAIGIGIMVAIFAGRGLVFIKDDPLTITAIMIGTLIGVTFFRGVAVGPLIAAGLTALILELFKSIK